jgi:hypothetical protein
MIFFKSMKEGTSKGKTGYSLVSTFCVSNSFFKSGSFEWYSISDIVIHNVYEDRAYKDVYWKLLKNGGVDGKWWGRAMEGVELTKVQYTHRGDTLRNCFEHWLRN